MSVHDASQLALAEGSAGANLGARPERRRVLDDQRQLPGRKRDGGLANRLELVADDVRDEDDASERQRSQRVVRHQRVAVSRLQGNVRRDRERGLSRSRVGAVLRHEPAVLRDEPDAGRSFGGAPARRHRCPETHSEHEGRDERKSDGETRRDPATRALERGQGALPRAARRRRIRPEERVTRVPQAPLEVRRHGPSPEPRAARSSRDRGARRRFRRGSRARPRSPRAEGRASSGGR